MSTIPFPRFFDLLDLSDYNGIRKQVDVLNGVILKCVSDYKSVYVFDFAGWAGRKGGGAFDRKMDFFAAQPISADAIGSFAGFLARTLRPLIISSSKVLALDLDNVLWGGVLGEDGPLGLHIGRDFPGNIYFAIQQQVLRIKRSGVLLVLLSKNNLADVQDAFLKIAMPLRLDDFIFIRVNWNDKYSNCSKIAEELNLGLDSFVFLDDQPFEQEQMRFHLPEVKVLPVNGDPLRILTALEQTWLFDAYRLSKEDLIRNNDYIGQIKRKNMERSGSSSEQFLQTLNLKVAILPIDEYSLARVGQILGKTNQFNLTTRRHPESKVREFMADDKNILLTLTLSDCFGEQGIIGLVIALANGDGICVDSFLLSCRAIGKGAEDALWSYLIRKASEKGYRYITAEYVITEKNAQVSSLYERFGMRLLKETSRGAFYDMSLPAVFSSPCWIEDISDKICKIHGK